MVQATHGLLAGENIYTQTSGYSYSPFLAMLAVPFAFLPHYVMRAVWYLVNVFSIVGLIGGSWWLAGGAPWKVIFCDRREWLAAALGLACSERYVSNALNHQQVDTFIAWLIVAGCIALLRQRTFAAGSLLGIAAACKATPMLFVPYLAWRREWIAAFTVALVAIGLNSAPNLIHAPPEGGTWSEQWLLRFALPVLDAHTYPGIWLADMADNQSLAGTIVRFITTTWIWSAHGMETVGRDPLIGPRAARLLIFCTLAVLFAISLWAIGRSRRIDLRNDETGERWARTVWEFGVILCLMLLAWPMSSRAHFVTLVLPAFCFARYTLRNRDPVNWGILPTAAAGG